MRVKGQDIRTLVEPIHRKPKPVGGSCTVALS